MSELLSVIIPAYNAEKYLANAVKSVTDYKKEAIEVIIIDDGSTDSTPQICEELAESDERVKVFHIENMGVSHGRNTGMEKASGEYIMFLDADDELELDEFTKAVEALKKSDYDIYIFPYTVVYEGKGCSRPVEPYNEGQITDKDFFRVIVGSTYMNFCWGKFYKREFIEKTGVKFKKFMKIGEDVDFQIKLVRHNPVMEYYNYNYVRYRQFDDSVMHRYGFERFDNLIEAYKMRTELAAETGMTEADKKDMYKDLGVNLLSYVKHVSYKPDRKATVKRLKEVFKSDDIDELLNRIPDGDMGIAKRIITVMLRKKQYALVVALLNIIKKVSNV